VIRAVQFPPVDPSQPSSFAYLMERATLAAGIEPARAERLSVRWALRQQTADVVHLHWLEYIVSVDPAPGRGLARTGVRSARLITSLLVLRARRIGIVWTIHNLASHDPVRPRVERVLGEATYALADEVIVHSDDARERVAARFRAARRTRPAHVIPHPNYVGVFPDAGEDRVAIRARLGLPADAYVYLCFGQVRAYKRLDALAEVFGRLVDDDARLLVVGRAIDRAEARRLEHRAARDPRIVLHLEHVPEDLVAPVHRASDAAVIAYRDVFSSGALLAALSQGLPVLAPGGGTVSELFAPPAVELFEDGGLLQALERARAHRGPGQRAAARAAALRFPWSEAGRRTAEVYRLSAAGGGGRRPRAAGAP
jgi:beta-1,4-mannosyltransferase